MSLALNTENNLDDSLFNLLDFKNSSFVINFIYYLKQKYLYYKLLIFEELQCQLKRQINHTIMIK